MEGLPGVVARRRGTGNRRFDGRAALLPVVGSCLAAKTRDEEVIRLLAIDRHSPGEFRCNQIVRNLDEFYGAFDVGATDELWLESAARVRIW